MLVDDNEKVWLLDVDGTPVFGEDERDRRVLERETLYSDVLSLAGWIKTDERGNTLKENDELISGVCGESEEWTGICKLRLGEGIFERNAVDTTNFKRVIPTKNICSRKDEFVEVGYFTALDNAQCEMENRERA